MFTEYQLEQLYLDWFKFIGYDYACGYNIAPNGKVSEHNGYRQIILFERLIQLPIYVLELLFIKPPNQH